MQAQFPNVLVCFQENAWMDSTIACKAAEIQFFPFLQQEGISDVSNLLLMDNLSAQHDETFIAQCAAANVVCRFGPPGLTETWQPVDHHVGLAYHKGVSKWQEDHVLSTEFRNKCGNLAPDAEYQRAMMVEAVSLTYTELETRRSAQELGSDPSIFLSAFRTTGCLISAGYAGQDVALDDAMHPDRGRQRGTL